MKKLLLLLLLLPCLALAEDADTALWDYILTDEGAGTMIMGDENEGDSDKGQGICRRYICPFSRNCHER